MIFRKITSSSLLHFGSTVLNYWKVLWLRNVILKRAEKYSKINNWKSEPFISINYGIIGEMWKQEIRKDGKDTDFSPTAPPPWIVTELGCDFLRVCISDPPSWWRPWCSRCHTGSARGRRHCCKPPPAAWCYDQASPWCSQAICSGHWRLWRVWFPDDIWQTDSEARLCPRPPPHLASRPARWESCSWFSEDCLDSSSPWIRSQWLHCPGCRSSSLTKSDHQEQI